MAAAAVDPENIINRPLDVQFAIHRLTVLNADPAFVLHGRIDLKRIGMAGHSFGAYTTMAVAGQKFRVSDTSRVADPRIKAAIAMSTPAPRGRAAFGGAYAGIAIPVFHLTGTHDADPLGTADPALRRVPYDQMQSARAYLLILSGGDHMVFSGQRRRGDGSNDATFHRLIQESTTAFWNMTLREDAAAQQWLEHGGFTQRLGQAGTFEQKGVGTGKR
jgi:predicted dienelactone hydrolase